MCLQKGGATGHTADSSKSPSQKVRVPLVSYLKTARSGFQEDTRGTGVTEEHLKVATSLLEELMASEKSQRTPKVWTWCFLLLRWGHLWEEQVVSWWGVQAPDMGRWGR
ncbi:unnamed protein product [Gulo gulo]|uniref:Uncharacterized protein n=1 Tax=Gulo gulo TaxID=48420 RepID=A0A9X9LLM1_GULGU|nr:unnamed protein product [Gulo gulo]